MRPNWLDFVRKHRSPCCPRQTATCVRSAESCRSSGEISDGRRTVVEARLKCNFGDRAAIVRRVVQQVMALRQPTMNDPLRAFCGRVRTAEMRFNIAKNPFALDGLTSYAARFGSRRRRTERKRKLRTEMHVQIVLRRCAQLPGLFGQRSYINARHRAHPGVAANVPGPHVKRRLEITLGIRPGARKIDRASAKANVVVNGRRIAPYFGDSTFYNGD
jgi:hypothetical protein